MRKNVSKILLFFYYYIEFLIPVRSRISTNFSNVVFSIKIPENVCEHRDISEELILIFPAWS